MNFRPEIPLRAAPAVTILGDSGIDLVMGPLDQWPQPGTETLMPRSDMRAGGSAGNTALALRHLGVPARLVSAIGNDALGQWLKDQFGDIEAELSVCAAATSLSVGLLHEGAERTFFTTRGHLELQDQPVLPPARDGDILLLTGVFLLPRLRRDYGRILQQGRDLGYRIALDTGWPPEGWTDAVIADVRSWLALADHVLLNEVEILRLGESDNLTTAMARLSGDLLPGASLVAKVGRDGAIGTRNGEIARAAPPPAAEIFDTVGAGDAFNAGYLNACTQGAVLGDALTAGCRTATQIISHFPRRLDGATPAKDMSWQTAG